MLEFLDISYQVLTKLSFWTYLAMCYRFLRIQKHIIVNKFLNSVDLNGNCIQIILSYIPEAEHV